MKPVSGKRWKICSPVITNCIESFSELSGLSNSFILLKCFQKLKQNVSLIKNDRPVRKMAKLTTRSIPNFSHFYSSLAKPAAYTGAPLG